MATCFGPPPLPPNKKSVSIGLTGAGSLAARRQRRRRQQVQVAFHQQQAPPPLGLGEYLPWERTHMLLQESYRSFRDAEDFLADGSTRIRTKKQGNKKSGVPTPPPLPPIHRSAPVAKVAPTPPPASQKPHHQTWSRGVGLGLGVATLQAPAPPGTTSRCRQRVRSKWLTPDELLVRSTPAVTPVPSPPTLPKCLSPVVTRARPPQGVASATRPSSQSCMGGSSRTLTRSASPRAGQVGRIGLFRSRSEGNIAALLESPTLVPASLSHPRAPGSPGLQRCLRALSGSLKNLLQLGGMSRPNKATPLAKKVAPPAVPDLYRLSGSSFGSFGSVGYCSSEDPADVARDGLEHTDIYGMSGRSPGHISYPAFTFPGPQGPPGKMGPGPTPYFNYHQHQLSLQEDQGIDMTQSPGRDSPGSSGSGSRHSTASLDSGRASGCQNRLGPASVLSSSPRCSLSSSSIGSSELSSGSSNRVERMLQQGIQDSDVVHAWLQDLHFEEYFPLFLSAGYDMHTISRMTPEDLTAIGIKKPNHRKKLKAEIAQLNIGDGLPEYIPGSLEEWLHLLRLEEYLPALQHQGYHSVEQVTTLAWEDLEDIGIIKLGHQKKVLLAIRRIQDLRAGKRILSPQDVYVSEGSALSTPDEEALSPQVPLVHKTFHSFHQPWEIETSRQQHLVLQGAAITVHQPMYSASPEFVPIKIRGGRGKSLESLEGNTEVTHHTFSQENTQTFYYQQTRPMHAWRPRSYDDGDLTPTNEIGNPSLHEGGGTLPRQRGPARHRPLAKVAATPSTPTIFAHQTLPRKRPPSPPKRHSSRCGDLSDSCDSVDAGSHVITTTVDLHHSSHSNGTLEDLTIQTPPPPPPAPVAPSYSHRPSWGTTADEIIASLSKQPGRTGSDASFKSSSSTESDSLPFANENAGTIKQRASRGHPTLTNLECADSDLSRNHIISPPHHNNNNKTSMQHRTTLIDSTSSHPIAQEPADVLNDIGNMLANLTDELDAMLEEEKRQGLNSD